MLAEILAGHSPYNNSGMGPGSGKVVVSRVVGVARKYFSNDGKVCVITGTTL